MHPGARQDPPGEHTLPLPEFVADDEPANRDEAEADERPGAGGVIRRALEASAEATETAAELVVALIRSILP